MSLTSSIPYFWTLWLWAFAGGLAGYGLVYLARLLPRKVLQYAEAPLQEWQGPGGGLERPFPAARRIWVPLLNAGLWVYLAATANLALFWPVLPAAFLASALLLLALIDWDTTLLPDLVVFPLGAAGLAASAAGLTAQGLTESGLSAAVVLVLVWGSGWLFSLIKGESGVGGGDLKLFAALAAWWGVLEVLYVMVWASLLTIAWNLAWRRFKSFPAEAEWPFGPAIVTAALIFWLWAG